MIGVKICGLSTPETLDAAIRHGASHLGFVFFPPSPRHVVFDRAASLAARVPEQIINVGVFVDPDDALVEQGVRAGNLGAIQLHKTSPERVAHLRTLSRVETWAAVAIKTRSDLATSASYVGAADRLLFDAKTPDHAALPGGLGLRFDWSLLDGWNHALPWALSGGLDADNVAEAINRTGATLVDVSSGVEDEPGAKNVDKIAAFLQAVARKR